MKIIDLVIWISSIVSIAGVGISIVALFKASRAAHQAIVERDKLKAFSVNALNGAMSVEVMLRVEDAKINAAETIREVAIALEKESASEMSRMNRVIATADEPLVAH